MWDHSEILLEVRGAEQSKLIEVNSRRNDVLFSGGFIESIRHPDKQQTRRGMFKRPTMRLRGLVYELQFAKQSLQLPVSDW